MWKNILTLGASIVFSIAAAEIALRAADISFPQFDRLDFRLGWSPRPAMEGTYAFEGRTHLKINSQGFRDADHETAKPDDRFRVAVLGDSFTEAREVALEDTFWKVMERRLAACLASGGRTVEVLGFAVNGYGTTQELLVLEDHVWKYAPDVVLLAFFTGNDVVNNSRELDGHPNRPYFVLREGSLVLDDSNLKKFGFAIRKYWKDMKVVAFNSLRSVQVARHAYKRIKTRIKYRDVGIDEQLHAGLDPKLYVPPADRAWADAWSVTEEMIRAMRDKVRARGADFWIVTLSTPVQVFPDAALRRRVSASLAVDDLLYPDRRIARLAEAEGIPAVILVERLRAYADAHGARLHGWGDFAGGHWNETGHRVAGQALAETLCTTYRQEN